MAKGMNYSKSGKKDYYNNMEGGMGGGMSGEYGGDYGYRDGRGSAGASSKKRDYPKGSMDGYGGSMAKGKNPWRGGKPASEKDGSAGYDRMKSGQPSTAGHKLHANGSFDVRGTPESRARIKGQQA